MTQIGTTRRIVRIIPEEQPASVPVPESVPAVPEPVKEPVPV